MDKRTDLGKPSAKPSRFETKATARIGSVGDTAQPSAEFFFPIVGIGASAGGLEALEQFFTHLPPGHGMAFVVVTHLDPNHKSVLAELLTRSSRMEFLQAAEGMKVEPECVYVIPPNSTLEISQGQLHLEEPLQARGRRHPIDHFLRSLAADQAENAICVILSGTGTDGTLGLKAVKEAGGLVIVQEEASARYSGMPSSAIHTGLVDLILPVEAIPGKLVEFRDRSMALICREPLREPDARGLNDLPKVFKILRNGTGQDFSGYKIKTVWRRVQRRMLFNNLENIADYCSFLKKTPEEVAALFKDLLIGVTNFFRDPKAFYFLNENVILKLVASGKPERPIRVWVAGCGTGEEAYSLAILLQEQINKSKQDLSFQVFATDIDKTAIDSARTGLYPENIAADVSAERLNNFFQKQDHCYKISSQIRESVIFSPHNLIQDPPFSNLDLICCRNLLIYLNPDTQKKILHLFWYALNPKGFLFLGGSETLGSAVDLFSVVDKTARIFQRGESGQPHKMDLLCSLPGNFSIDLRQIAPEATTKKPDVAALATKALLQNYLPPCAVVNDKYEVVYFPTSTSWFLAPPVGEPSANILAMVQSDLKSHLLTLMQKAFSERKGARINGLKFRKAGVGRVADLVVKPLKEPVTGQELALVILEEKGLLPPLSGDKDAGEEIAEVNETAQEVLIRQLEEEVKSTREQLRNTIEDGESVHEELKSSNEELMSMNEELQSTNEELEASKEELQALNEELVSLNAEVRSKMTELERTNSDIVNLLESTQIATIFLDKQLRVKQFTPPMAGIFNLIPTDVGRPLHHISSKLAAADLLKDAEKVLKTLVPLEQVVMTGYKRWYTMRIRPYRTVKDVIDGVVITFSDITESKRAEKALRLNESRLSVLVKLSQMTQASLKEFISYALDNALATTESDIGGIALLNEEETALTSLVCCEGPGAAYRQSSGPIPLASGKAGVWSDVIRQRRPIINNDNSGPETLTLETSEKPVAMKRFLAVPFLDGGRIVAVIVVANKEEAYKDADILPLKLLMEGMWILVQKEKTRKELERAKKNAEETSRAKSDFLANMSHEIRTPLTAVMGATKLALDQDLNPELRMLLEMAGSASDSLLLLINDILDFSRIEAKKLVFAEKPFAPRECVESAVDMLSMQNREKKVQLHWQVTSGVPALLIGDEHRLRQVLLNLIGNAVKFTHEGEVRVRVEPCPQNNAPPGKSFFKFSIRDTGIGIPKDKQYRLFLSFSQGDSSSTRRYGGSGLGLAISKGIVEGMEGQIGFESEDGKGSLFYFTVPFGQAEDITISKISPSGKEKGKSPENFPVPSKKKRVHRILLAEDEPLIHRLVKILLDGPGFEVVTAFDGKEALELWVNGNIDLILMDIQMPRMDGYEATRLIRKKEESSGAHTPIVAMTAHALDKDRKKCLKAGMDDYVSKPIDRDVLFEIMNRYLGG